jgi:multidrug efflux pump subunit AcrB
MKITKNAIKYRIATTAIVVALFILGLYGLSSLSVDFLPNITYPMIKVHIWWRGATPHEIEKNLAEPIERQMATVDDLDYLDSSSIEGIYTLLVNFKYGVDVNVAYQDALAAMARVAKELPKDIDPPIVIKSDPSQLPVLQLTIKSSSWDLVKLRTWTDEWFQDRMLAVSGVAGTEVVGGLKREIRIHLDKEVLEKHGLTVAMISKRLAEENIEQLGGRVTTGKKEIIARTTGEFSSVDDIGSVLILKNGSSNLFLKDIASIEDSHEEARVITRFNRDPAVKLSVLKQSTANTVEIAENVSRKIEEMKKTLPDHIEIGIIENQADYVNSALKGVSNTAFQAALLVILIMYLFLGSFRQIMIMILSLPVTLVLNFGLMKLSGFSINIFSLGGLVIAIGVLLDNSIVVIENITRRKKENPDENNEDAIENGTDEVGSPIVAATLSFLALFLPFLLVPGLTSLLFKELILVIACIVVISLVISVSLTPMLASLFLKIKKSKIESGFQIFFNKVTQFYGAALTKTIEYKWVTLSFFVFILITAGFLLNSIGSEFLPLVDDGRAMIKVKFPTGTSISVTDSVLNKLEEIVKDDPVVESFFTLSGGKFWSLYTFEIANEGEIDIQLIPRSKRNITTEDYVKKIKPLVEKIKIPGGKAMVMRQKINGLKKI